MVIAKQLLVCGSSIQSQASCISAPISHLQDQLLQVVDVTQKVSHNLRSFHRDSWMLQRGSDCVVPRNDEHFINRNGLNVRL
jgi:hypothetical protein